MSSQGKSRISNWREEADQALINILAEHKINNDGFVNGNFTKEAWRMTLQKFNDTTRLGYSLENLKNRFKNLKKIYGLYLNLKSKSGWGWDDEKNMPRAPTEEAWEELAASNKDYRTIQGKPFNLMEQMYLITSSTLASGDVAAMNDGQSYLDQQEESHVDEDHLDLNLSLDFSHTEPGENQQPNMENQQPNMIEDTPTPSNTSVNKNIGAKVNSKKRRRIADYCSDSLEKIAKLGEERLALQREILELQKSIAPPVSLALAQLMKVDGIPGEMLYKAIDLMKVVDDRCIFLGLSEHLRLGWILNRLGFM